MHSSVPTLLVGAAVLALACGEDCAPGPGYTPDTPWQCCKVGADVVFPEELGKHVKKCTAKIPVPDKSKNLDDLWKNPDKELKKAFACAAECVFGEAKLLSDDKKLDKEAISKLLSSISKDWAAETPKILETCFTSYTADIDASQECKSGAVDFEHCIMRESFLNCPKALWRDSSDCKKLKNQVAKCPKFPVLLPHHS